jgi:thiamine biosynthesis lipoprotein
VSPEHLEFEALGTTCQLYAVDVDAQSLAEGATWVLELHRRLTRFDPCSELSAFNASNGGWVRVSATLEDLLREALYAHEISGGLVHAGVLHALLAAGYTQTFSELAKAGPRATVALDPLPPLSDILAVAPGAAKLRPGYGIDFGGIAKGWLAASGRRGRGGRSASAAPPSTSATRAPRPAAPTSAAGAQTSTILSIRAPAARPSRT